MLSIYLIGVPGGMEMMLIAFVILLLFGGKKLPELMRGLGKGIKEFNSAKASIETEVKESMREPKVEKTGDKSAWIERNDS